MKPVNLILAAVALLAGASAACGETSSSPAATTTATVAAPATTSPVGTATPTTAAATAASSVTVTAVENGEKYAYEPATFTVKAGEITVKLMNKAGNERPHTIAVKNPAGGTDIVRSGRVEPGASADVKFTVPVAGQYQIYCTLMGHADRGQTGTMTVQ